MPINIDIANINYISIFVKLFYMFMYGYKKTNMSTNIGIANTKYISK